MTLEELQIAIFEHLQDEYEELAWLFRTTEDVTAEQIQCQQARGDALEDLITDCNLGEEYKMWKIEHGLL